jgi:hypothetical protein
MTTLNCGAGRRPDSGSRCHRFRLSHRRNRASANEVPGPVSKSEDSLTPIMIAFGHK